MVEMTVSNEEIFEEAALLLLLLNNNKGSHFERRECKVRNLLGDITRL